MNKKHFLITTNDQLYFAVAESSAELLWVLAKDKEILQNIDGDNYFFSIDLCNEHDFKEGRIDDMTVEEYFKDINKIMIADADFDHVTSW